MFAVSSSRVILLASASRWVRCVRTTAGWPIRSNTYPRSNRPSCPRINAGEISSCIQWTCATARIGPSPGGCQVCQKLMQTSTVCWPALAHWVRRLPTCGLGKDGGIGTWSTTTSWNPTTRSVMSHVSGMRGRRRQTSCGGTSTRCSTPVRPSRWQSSPAPTPREMPRWRRLSAVLACLSTQRPPLMFRETFRSARGRVWLRRSSPHPDAVLCSFWKIPSVVFAPRRWKRSITAPY